MFSTGRFTSDMFRWGWSLIDQGVKLSLSTIVSSDYSANSHGILASQHALKDKSYLHDRRNC